MINTQKQWFNLLTIVEGFFSNPFQQKKSFENLYRFNRMYYYNQYTVIHRYISVSILNLQYRYTYWNITYCDTSMYHSIVSSLVSKKPSVKADLAVYSHVVDASGQCMSVSLICGQICQKGSYTRSFRSHFLWSFDRYSKRPTVHVCIIAKALTVCFYWCLIHRPVWHLRMLRWSVNGSNCPARQTAGRESLQDCLVRLGIDVATFWDMWSWKQPELKPFGHKKVFVSEVPATSWLPTTSTLHPYRNACGIDYLMKYTI